MSGFVNLTAAGIAANGAEPRHVDVQTAVNALALATQNAINGVTGGLGLVQLLAQGVGTPLTGTTSPTPLATVAVPGGTLGTNGSLRVTIQMSWTNSANGKTVAITFGGQSVISTTQTTNAGMQMIQSVRNRNSLTAQVTFPSINSYSQTGTAPTVLSVNTANAASLVITGTLASAGDTMTLEGYTVELLNP